MSDHHYYEYHQHRDHFIISLLAIAVAIIVIIITMILASFFHDYCYQHDCNLLSLLLKHETTMIAMGTT